MSEKGKYKTKHRADLIAYLKTVPGQHVTAADISDHFRQQGTAMGTATIYRQLERMVDDGLVNKYIIDKNSSACFEYVDPDACHHPVCYHCKCEKCGRLIHLECEELVHVQDHVLADHGFMVDPMRTVFYGICRDCRKAGA